MTSSRTGRSLNESAHRKGGLGPYQFQKRPVCRNCGGRWNGGAEILCEPCLDAKLDLLNEMSRGELEAEDCRESDREIVL